MSINSITKRNQIILLLYTIFVCFSVVQIKVSVLDSNIYVIQTLESIQKKQLNKISISNLIIQKKIDSIKANPIANSFFNISLKFKQNLTSIDNLIYKINNDFKKNKTDLIKQFDSKLLIEKSFKNNNSLSLLENELFNTNQFIKNSPFKLANDFESLIPLSKKIKNFKGNDINWQDYFFIHKLTSVSYLQLQRIKLLLIQEQLYYQEAVIYEIGYKDIYYSKNDTTFYDLNNLNNNIVKNSDVIQIPETSIVNPEQKNDFMVDELLVKSILGSLHTEFFFVGLENVLISDLTYTHGQDYDFEISPKAIIVSKDNDYKVVFDKIGNYNLKIFYFKNKERKLLFDKKIVVSPLPDPIIKLKGDNLNNYLLTRKDLSSTNRLEAKILINNLTFLPGRINKYNVTRIHNGIEEETAVNIGEVFQSPVQKVFSSLIKNDFLLFDQISMTYIDGSTRTSTPLIYKIIN